MFPTVAMRHCSRDDTKCTISFVEQYVCRGAENGGEEEEGEKEGGREGRGQGNRGLFLISHYVL